jgi:membrane-bound metal-dependent hydrolase YbcI (DUF457 family)
MFIGHYGVGFTAKSLAPKTSLGTLTLATLFPDVLWIVFAYAGVEQITIRPGITAVNALDLYDIAFSHSLLADLVWAAAFAGLYFLARGYRRGAWVVFAIVLSHWLLDFVSHRPDMPLAPGVHTVRGLGLWNSRLATFVVEGGLWLAVVILYLRTTGPAKSAGKHRFWIMVVLLTVLWLLNLQGAAPPNLNAVKIGNSVMFFITQTWAYWMDRVRPARPSGEDAQLASAGA